MNLQNKWILIIIFSLVVFIILLAVTGKYFGILDAFVPEISVK